MRLFFEHVSYNLDNILIFYLFNNQIVIAYNGKRQESAIFLSNENISSNHCDHIMGVPNLFHTFYFEQLDLILDLKSKFYY